MSVMYLTQGEEASEGGNLQVGAVSRHSLDQVTTWKKNKENIDDWASTSPHVTQVT